MTETQLFDRERRLTDSLRALFSWREMTQHDIEQAWESASSEAESERSRAVSLARRRYESDIEGIELEAANARQRIDETLSPEIERLRLAQKNVIAESLEHHAGKVEAIKKERDESIWLAETVYDSDESQSRKRHATGVEGVKSARHRITTAIENAAQTIREDGWERLADRNIGPIEPAPAIPDNASTNPEAALDVSTAEVESIGDRLASNRPLRLSAPLAWWIGVCVLAVLAAVGALIIEHFEFAAWSLMPPFVVLIIATGLWFLLRIFGRKRLRADIREFERSASEAQAIAEAANSTIDTRRSRESAAVRDRRDREMKRAHEEFTKRIAQRDELLRTRIAEIETAYGPKLAELQQRETSERERIESRRIEQEQSAALRRDTLTSTANTAFDNATVHARSARDEGWRALGDRWNREMAELDREADGIESATALLTPTWETDGDVASWEPPHTMSAIPGALIGTIRLSLNNFQGQIPSDERLRQPSKTERELPMAVDLLARSSMLLRARSSTRPEAFAILRNTMLRLLTLLPPSKVRFTMIDPVGLGQNFAGFMHLADHLPALVGDRIWTEPRHIEQRLADLTEHMEQVIQKYLRNEYSSLDAYNQRAGEIAEPYRFLVIADFPTNISDNAAQRLASIANSGARCGVHMLILADPDADLPKNLDIADIERAAIVLGEKDGRFRVEDPALAELPFDHAQPIPEEISTALLHKVGTAASDASRVEVPFSAVSPPPDAIWTRSAASDVRVPLGRSGATKLQELILGRGTAQHALIAGKTGSGKSTLLHVLITNMALWFSPDEVEFYLVDFKKGVEFKTYATHSLPHARVVAVETDREFGLSVLRRLDEELKQRAELFRAAGVQDLAAYRRTTGGVMPRSLLVIDEFQELFTEDDRIAQDSALLLDRIVRQGRAFGVHVVLGSQTLAGAYTLNRATMGQMNVRIALQCSESDSYIILSEDNAAARLLSRPGEAIYNDAGGLIEGNSPFQIVWLPESVRDNALSTASTAANERLAAPPEPPIVFEGGAPADIRENKPLRRILAGHEGYAGVPIAYLGEPISIRSPIGAVFRRQGGANLLIVGQQDETATALMANALLSLSVQLGQSGHLTIIDPTPPDSSLAHALPALIAHLPTPSMIVDHSAAESAVAQIHADLQIRQDAPDEKHPPRFLCIHALHRVRALRRSEDAFSFGSTDPYEPPKPDRMLASILAEGPPLGIHVLAWGDTLTTVERCFDRSALREFEQRVLLQMSATDSAAIIDSPAASRLGLRRAIFYTEDSPEIERFRPYALLDPDEVGGIISGAQPL